MGERDRRDDEGLVRAIGPWGLGTNLVNLVVGAGIFTLPGLVAARLGAAAFIAYVVCAVAVGLVLLILYLGVSLAVIRLRLREGPPAPGAFRVPGGLTIPILSCAFVLGLLAQLAPDEAMGLAALLLASALVYVGVRMRERSRR